VKAQVHTLTVPSWHPSTVNALMRSVRGRIRLKKQDRELITVYARLAGVPRAEGRRRISLNITLGPGQRACDPDAYWKSLLDGLVVAGLLVDDNRNWCELGEVRFDRGPARATTITLEELAG
jgi:hypothetical protein